MSNDLANSEAKGHIWLLTGTGSLGTRRKTSISKTCLTDTGLLYSFAFSLCSSPDDPTGLSITRNVPGPPQNLNQSAFNPYFGDIRVPGVIFTFWIESGT